MEQVTRIMEIAVPMEAHMGHMEAAAVYMKIMVALTVVTTEEPSPEGETGVLVVEEGCQVEVGYLVEEEAAR